MWKKVLSATAAIIVATSASGSTDETFEQDPAFTNSIETPTAPDSEKIITDLIGHHMYVSETVPGIWTFSSPANIRRGDIRSTRWNGDVLEYTFMLTLIDQEAPKDDAYRAETKIAYKLIDNSWQLQTVQAMSFQMAGNNESSLSDDC